MSGASAPASRTALGQGLLVEVMNQHASAARLEVTRDADVVAVRVSQDDGLDIARREPEPFEIGVE